MPQAVACQEELAFFMKPIVFPSKMDQQYSTAFVVPSSKEDKKKGRALNNGQPFQNASNMSAMQPRAHTGVMNA